MSPNSNHLDRITDSAGNSAGNLIANALISVVTTPPSLALKAGEYLLDYLLEHKPTIISTRPQDSGPHMVHPDESNAPYHLRHPPS